MIAFFSYNLMRAHHSQLQWIDRASIDRAGKVGSDMSPHFCHFWMLFGTGVRAIRGQRGQ